MLGRLLLLFMIMPFLELFGLIQVHGAVSARWGDQYAWFFTLGMMILTAGIGMRLIKSQGLRLAAEVQAQLQRRQMPSQTMLEGVLLLAGAVGLIIPGYLTDICGLVLLLPQTRSFFVRRLKSWIGTQAQSGHVFVHRGGVHHHTGTLASRADEGEIIDVEPIHKS